MDVLKVGFNRHINLSNFKNIHEVLIYLKRQFYPY